MLLNRAVFLFKGRLLLGLGLWLLFLALPLLGWHRAFSYPGIINAVYLWAPACLVGPSIWRLLGADLSRVGWRGRFFRLQIIFELPAVVLLYLSFLLPSGPLAALFVLPWLILVLSLAFQGLLLLLERWQYPEELSLSMALIFLLVGAVWLSASRLGLSFLGFPPVIVILTAVHFHFAGFASCLILGAVGRVILPEASPFFKNVYYVLLVGALLGIPLLALGILAFPSLEIVSALVFTASLWLWALFVLGLLLPKLTQVLPRLLLFVAVASIFWSMAWAVRYALGTYLGLNWVGILTMAGVHGAVNAFGFASSGLLALMILQPKPRQNVTQIPFSRLWSAGFVGPEFFHKQNLVAQPSSDTQQTQPTGLIDDITSFSRPDFDVAELPESIRLFYEQTQSHALRVSPEWQPGFVWLGRLFRRLMNRIGQMALPIEAEGPADVIDSQILPLRSQIDGRDNVRAWVRTYTETGQAVYAAAYSQHQNDGQTYMNIAFPLPGGHLTSILRLDWHQKTLCLSSLPQQKINTNLGIHPAFSFEKNQHQGVYLCGAGITVRLPINESIYVWSPEDVPYWPWGIPEQVTVLARHDMWLMGILCLRLYYSIYPE